MKQDRSVMSRAIATFRRGCGDGLSPTGGAHARDSGRCTGRRGAGGEAARRAPRLASPLLVVLTVLGGAGGALAQTSTGWKVVGWNNLGMHCDDADYAVFTVIPPYNVLLAQVFDASGDLVTSPNRITVTYQAVADPSGSINTTSAGKTNFWDHVLALFGVALPVDTGLAGAKMRGPANTPQPMAFNSTYHWFIADGIPITPYDDTGVKNYFPMMRVTGTGAGRRIDPTRTRRTTADPARKRGSGPSSRGGGARVRPRERGGNGGASPASSCPCRKDFRRDSPWRADLTPASARAPPSRFPASGRGGSAAALTAGGWAGVGGLDVERGEGR